MKLISFIFSTTIVYLAIHNDYFMSLSEAASLSRGSQNNTPVSVSTDYSELICTVIHLTTTDENTEKLNGLVSRDIWRVSTVYINTRIRLDRDAAPITTVQLFFPDPYGDIISEGNCEVKGPLFYVTLSALYAEHLENLTHQLIEFYVFCETDGYHCQDYFIGSLHLVQDVIRYSLNSLQLFSEYSSFTNSVHIAMDYLFDLPVDGNYSGLKGNLLNAQDEIMSFYREHFVSQESPLQEHQLSSILIENLNCNTTVGNIVRQFVFRIQQLTHTIYSVYTVLGFNEVN